MYKNTEHLPDCTAARNSSVGLFAIGCCGCQNLHGFEK